MREKLLLIYNPYSGDGHIKSRIADAIEYFTKKGFEVTVHPTQGPEDAKIQIMKKAGEYNRIVVCGGDGMMHEAVNGCQMAKESVLIGYIPSGTVNDFAMSHEIPLDFMEALDIAASDSWETMDVGLFNDRYFSYVAAFGVATSVSYDTPQDQKRRLARLAYILNALGKVDFAHWENNCTFMNIEWEGGSDSGDYLYGMVSNSKYVGGIEQFTRDIFDLQDGKLEGLFIKRPSNLGELNMILAGVARGDFTNPLFIRVQSPWFHFSGDATPWTLDGEYGGVLEDVHASAVSHVLKLLMPAGIL